MATSSAPKTLISVIIPARNEERRLPACLQALAEQDYRGQVQVIVVPNGCSDSTASVARSHVGRMAPGQTLLVSQEMQAGSKPEALNKGDRLARAGQRVYLDADALLSSNALSMMAKALEQPGIHICAPRRKIKRPVGMAARCYARVWSSWPYSTTLDHLCRRVCAFARG